MGAQRGRGAFLRILSGALTVTFAAQGVVWAVPVSPAVTPSAPQVRFELPPAVALIDDQYAAAGGKLVVLIQDAHTNESGQMNLARALEQILPSENIRTLFTEGAAADSDVTPDALKVGPAAERERVGQAYLRKGLLSGSEYFSMTSDHGFRIIGTEDGALYREAGELFRSAADGRSASANWLNRLVRTLETLKVELWSPELKALDARRERYRAGELALTDYFSALADAARANGLDLSGYPNLRSLLDLKEREARIDFKQAGEDEARAIKGLPADRRDSLAGLKTAYSPFKRTGSDARGTDGFFAALRSELDAAQPDMAAKYPALYAYFDYISQSRGLNAPDALRELESFEASVWRALAGTRDAVELEIFWQAAGRMRRIADLKASPADLEAFAAQPAAHDPEFAAAWANRRLADLNKHFDFTLTLDPSFEAPLATAVSFYRINSQRDAVMADRILRRMDAAGETRAAVVTGGFHTPNLKRLLRARGVSYISVLPQVTHETDTVRYERLVRESLDETGETGPAAFLGPELRGSGAGSNWMLPPVAARMSTQRAIINELNGPAAGPEAVPGPEAPTVSAARMSEAEEGRRIERLIREAQSSGQPFEVHLTEGRVIRGPFRAFSATREQTAHQAAGTERIITEGQHDWPIDGVASVQEFIMGPDGHPAPTWSVNRGSYPADRWPNVLAELPQGEAEFRLDNGQTYHGDLVAVMSMNRTQGGPVLRALLRNEFTPDQFVGIRIVIPSPPAGGDGASGAAGGSAAPGVIPIILSGSAMQPWGASDGSRTRVREEGSEDWATAEIVAPSAAVPGAPPAGGGLYVSFTTYGSSGTATTGYRLIFARPGTTLPINDRIQAQWTGPTAPKIGPRTDRQHFNFIPVAPSTLSAARLPQRAVPAGPPPPASGARMSQLQQQGFTLPVRGSQEQFAGIDHEFGIDITRITAKPLNDQAKARAKAVGHLDLTDGVPNQIVYSALLASFYEAAAAANFTGLGKRDDVKTAADAAAVELGIRSYLAITSNNPNVAIVTFAAEGRKDGSVSQPLRSVFFKGAVKTENTFADMVKRIHELQEQGVTVYASKDDAVDNTNGLVNPNAVKLPGDSISIIGLIEIPKNWQRPGGPQTPFLVADEAIRMGGPTLSVPGASPETMRRIEARLTPFSGPKEILQVLTEEAAPGFDPNKVSFVILGTGDKQARHQQMIGEAAEPGFKAQYPGVKLITIPDGDPFPRILAAVGGELHEERHWIVIGRGGSTENILIMHALRTLASSTYVHTVVSAKGTDKNFSASNTDGRVRPGDAKKLASPDDAVRAREEARQEEFDIVQELRTPRGILQSPKLTPQDYAPGVLSLVSITGATPRYGAMEKLFHRITLVRTKKGDKKANGTARGLITLQDGSAFAVDIRFTTEDYFRTRQDLMSASAVAQTHLDGLRPDIEEGFNRLITQAASQLPAGERWDERFREAQQAYENEDQFLLAADQLEQAYLEAARKRLFKDSTYQDDWVNLIGLLRGRPVSGARLARPAEAGAALTALSRTSSAVILRPVSTAAVPTNLLGTFRRFAASAFLSGSAGDLEQLPIQIEGARFAVLQTSRVTPATVRVTVRGGGSEEVPLEPLRDESRQSRGRTQEPGWTADDEALTAFRTRENDLRDSIRAVAGKGLVEAYYRIPLGDLFPEALDGKPNLSADQVRDEIVILLSELAAFAESPDIGDRIQFYLDLENLSEANRAWLDRLVGQGRKTARFSQFHILSEKDPLPSRKLVFNWYVNEDHRDWNTDANTARRVITGSHLRLAPTRPGLVQRWGVAVRIPVEALYAALPDASTTASAEVADRFVQAPNFSDQGLFYERSVRDGWFHRKAVFASPADLLVRVQGAEFFLDNQVASYLFIKDVGEWVSFVRRMRQKTATSV